MRRNTAALLAGLALFLVLLFSGFGRAKTYSTLGAAQRDELTALPAHEDVPAHPQLVVERFRVIAASPEKIFEVLIAAQKWPDWDHGVSRVDVPTPLPLAAGDHFTKVERGMRVDARVLEAERGKLVRWRGLAPGNVIGVHSYQLVKLDSRHTLVVDREEFSNPALRLFAWCTDFGLGKRFERTLEGLKAAAEPRPRS